MRYQRRLRKAQYDAPAAIRQRQRQQMGALIDHARSSSPFWKARCSAAGVYGGPDLSYDEFSRLPILTKHELQEHFDQLRAADYAPESLHIKKTSGSTGTSVRVYADEEEHQIKRACGLLCDEWTGWKRGERVAAVWGNPVYRERGWKGRLRNALLDRFVYLDTLRMDERAMEKFLLGLRRRPPSLLFGHAHSLYLLAQFVASKGGPGFQVKGIISTAMVLHDWERRIIEDVFECQVTNRYGCEEVSLIACECEQHEGLHINTECVFVEVLRADGTPAEPGETGMVIVTDLVNRAMPIIRYQVGDMASWLGRPCSCGRGTPLLERVEGRVADYVVTPTGELISGISLTENFAVLIPGIAQLQILQETVDFFVFRIVKGPNYSEESSQDIESHVRQRFGPEVRFRCEFVEQIPREPSGKYRFCISKVPNPFSDPRSNELAGTRLANQSAITEP